MQAANKIVILTGAGVSAESGIPTFRGAGGLWRRYNAQDLATPRAFNKDPSLVWEFYHYRREVALRAMPNRAHKVCAWEEKLYVTSINFLLFKGHRRVRKPYQCSRGQKMHRHHAERGRTSQSRRIQESPRTPRKHFQSQMQPLRQRKREQRQSHLLGFGRQRLGEGEIL